MSATGGYVGSILILDLSNKSYEVISSEPYQKWGGGHGMGSALFWDYCKDKKVSAFDEGNVVTISSNPFSGTPVPSSSARVEIQGIGSFADPEWFTRSSMGGRVGGMMKAAGYDAVVITGKADNATWVNIVNDTITFNDASGLWGMDTGETQEVIWAFNSDNTPTGEWYGIDEGRDGGRTTQKCAVMCIGPAGENMARVATITHDAGHHAGQSGLGAVWSSKNLKAISFLGSHSIPIADPNAILDLRVKFTQNHAYNVDAPVLETPNADVSLYGFITRHPGFNGIMWGSRELLSRPSGCQGCVRNCRHNFSDGVGNEIMCSASLFYQGATELKDQIHVAGLMNRLGLNGFESVLLPYVRNLYKMGELGQGKTIESKLNFDAFGTYQFGKDFVESIAYRTDIGDALAEGTVRAAKEWGRWDQDSKSGLLAYPNWNYSEHYDPRLEVEWSYGTIIGERDINEHAFNWHVHWMPLITAAVGEKPLLSAEEVANKLAKSTGLGDPMCFDYSPEGIYSDAKLKAVSWHRWYSRFWVQSMGMCDWVWPYLIEYASPTKDDTAPTPGYEPQFFKAVTGQELTYEDSLKLGQKIFTLDRAIWMLQGRNRDQEVYADYVYEVPTSAPYFLPTKENGKWDFSVCLDRKLDRKKFEDVKTRLYKMQGWNEKGCPTRETLESFDLKDVADKLAQEGIL